MRICKYGLDYNRRKFMLNTSATAGAGILGSLWGGISQTAIAAAAYPEELLDIEAFT